MLSAKPPETRTQRHRLKKGNDSPHLTPTLPKKSYNSLIILHLILIRVSR
jgi:hypothetical protein